MNKKQRKKILRCLQKQSYHTETIDGQNVQFRWSYVGSVPSTLFVQSKDSYFGSIFFSQTDFGSHMKCLDTCSENIVLTMMYLLKNL